MRGSRRIHGSFRDPSGFVYERDGTLYRQVNRSFAEAFDAFIGSGLYETLASDGLLIPHRPVGSELAATPGAHAVLQPEPVAFVSYPYEWCFSQLKDAALVTLRAQRAALAHGMTLRDASAYNVQFHRGRPLVIDTLSFEPVREGEPWRAYAQFCQHFLAPLAVMSARDVRLAQLLRVHLDGLPLDLAARLLPRRARLRPSVWLHLAAHARVQRRHAEDGAPERVPRRSRRGRFTMQAFRGLVDSLERAVRGLAWEPPRSVWGEYYGGCRTYPPEALERKEGVVEGFLQEVTPRVVWDLGANTGRFSRLAAQGGAFTVSLDSDPGVVERNYRDAVAEGSAGLLPLVMDLTNPSPGIGWTNQERLTLLERGPADLVMALALAHHLVIGNNVPLDDLVAFLAAAGRDLIVEWVPEDDPQVQRMLATREGIPDYGEARFRAALERRFNDVRAEELPGSRRVLYLARGRR